MLSKQIYARLNHAVPGEFQNEFGFHSKLDCASDADFCVSQGPNG